MDYGLAVGCSALGEVTTAEEYAGGIVGYSSAAVRNCRARVNLSGKRYVGGIAGLGKDISCSVMPHFENRAELCGSVAGYADGAIAENLYSDSTVGGVDGFSFTGQSDYMDYGDFAALPDTPDFFRSIGVTFVKDGVTVETVEVPFGGRIASGPSVADEDGMYWQWNDFDPNEAVYYSRTVEGGVYPAGHNDLDRRGRAAVPCGGHFPRRADASCCALCAGCGNARHRCGVHSRGIHGARFRLFRAPHRAHAYLGVRESLYTLGRHAHAAFVHLRRQLYCFPAGQRRIDRVPCAGNLRTGWIIGGIAGGAAAAAAVVLVIVRKRRKKDLTSS